MRIFFGATLPEITKGQILDVQDLLRPIVPGARFEGKDKLHITLQFIGDFPSGDVESLFESASKELARLSAKSSPVEVTGLAYFPNMKMKRGIWLDCSDDGTLASLAGAIISASWKHGIVPEGREFKSHITVARIARSTDAQGNRNFSGSTRYRNESEPEEDLQKLAARGKLSVDQFFPISAALFESTLKPSGSEYRILYEYSLV